MAKEWRGYVGDEAYSEEDDRVYEEAMTSLTEMTNAGTPFDEAAGRLQVSDPDLLRVIIDDFLKISIAELHFNKGQELSEIAGRLGIEPERLERLKREMIEEVRDASVEMVRRQWSETGGEGEGNPDQEGGAGKHGNA